MIITRGMVGEDNDSRYLLLWLIEECQRRTCNNNQYHLAQKKIYNI